MGAPAIVVAFLVVFWLLVSVKVLNEYERGVIFRLGKLLPAAKGPGLVIVAWPIDRMLRVSLRTVVLDVPPQDVITRDNVSVKVNAVVYFRVMDPVRAVVEVENYLYATSQMAQTTLRSILGGAHLDELLAERERLAPEAAGGHRPAHRSLGREGHPGGGEGRGPAARDGAGHGQAGGVRAREARQDHPRLGRVRGLQAAHGGGADAGRASRWPCTCATCRR